MPIPAKSVKKKIMMHQSKVDIVIVEEIDYLKMPVLSFIEKGISTTTNTFNIYSWLEH